MPLARPHSLPAQPPARPSTRSPGRRLGLAACALAGLLPLVGCGVIRGPQPWEKGELAKPEMRMDADPLDARFTQHTYFSKEAASGGSGVGGGGCGCN
ncbi:MAG: DUF4266 domain-containing protein [Leptothrix sp. (in: b-proteobacteria)]